MVLEVNGHTIRNLPRTTTEFFQQNPYLKGQSENLKAIPVKEVESNGCLYVCQKEYAVVPHSDDRVLYVGSEDATTCHIVIFEHINGIAIAHFDGSRFPRNILSDDRLWVSQILRELIGDSKDENVCVYGVGGFAGDIGIRGVPESEKISIDLLKVMHSLEYKFILTQWSSCSLNTIYDDGRLSGLPFHYGICYDRENKSVFPASFASRGPEFLLRSAMLYCSNFYRMKRAYNPENHSIEISVFENINSSRFKNMSELPEDIILDLFSTSPTAEPPHFAENMRQIFDLLASNPYPDITLFDEGKPKVFVLQCSGEWKRKS